MCPVTKRTQRFIRTEYILALLLAVTPLRAGIDYPNPCPVSGGHSLSISVGVAVVPWSFLSFLCLDK